MLERLHWAEHRTASISRRKFGNHFGRAEAACNGMIGNASSTVPTFAAGSGCRIRPGNSPSGRTKNRGTVIRSSDREDGRAISDA